MYKCDITQFDVCCVTGMRSNYTGERPTLYPLTDADAHANTVSEVVEGHLLLLHSGLARPTSFRRPEPLECNQISAAALSVAISAFLKAAQSPSVLVEVSLTGARGLRVPTVRLFHDDS